MPAGSRKERERWTVTVVPAGAPAEAEAAVRQARRIVVAWIRRGDRPEGAQEEAGEC